MQSFKKFLLNEEENNSDFFWPEEDIIDWATDNGMRVFKKYNVESPNKNGQVVEPQFVNGMLNCVNITNSSFPEALPLMKGSSDLRQFPCQFGEITRHFFMGDCNLGTLKGAPIHVGGKFSISNNNHINTLEYLPQSAGKYILRGTSITSFSGIHKIVKRINLSNEDYDHFILPFTVKECLLGFFNIHGCKDIGYSNSATTSELQKYPEAVKAINIVGKHLQEEHDMLECQEELITQGLKSYAKL